jgi:hypothetical protein
MMDFFRRNVVAEFEPDRVEKVDFFWREVRSVWAKVEHVLIAIACFRELRSDGLI